MQFRGWKKKPSEPGAADSGCGLLPVYAAGRLWLPFRQGSGAGGAGDGAVPSDAEHRGLVWRVRCGGRVPQVR
eukprot:365371-Chlamydomonas_euryale.AAC.6